MAQLKCAILFFALAQEFVFGSSTLLKGPWSLAHSGSQIICSTVFSVFMHYFFLFFRIKRITQNIKYKYSCYIPLEPGFCLDSDFLGFKSLIITHKKYNLPKHSHRLRTELIKFENFEIVHISVTGLINVI